MAGPDALAGTDLGDLLDDLTDATNIHPGIHQICAGIRAIANDTTLDVSATKLLIVQLCCNTDIDVVSAIGALTAWIAHPDTNPVLRGLPEDVQKTVQHQGELAHFDLGNPRIHEPASAACAALDTRREVPAMTDEKRKEMHAKVKKTNDQSNKPYPK